MLLSPWSVAVVRRIAALNPACHGTGMKESAFWAAFKCLMLASEASDSQFSVWTLSPRFLPVAQDLWKEHLLEQKPKKPPNSLGSLSQATLVWGNKPLQQDGQLFHGWWWEPPLQRSLQQHLQLNQLRLSRLLFSCTHTSSWAEVLWDCSGKHMLYHLKLWTKHLLTISYVQKTVLCEHVLEQFLLNTGHSLCSSVSSTGRRAGGSCWDR